VKHHDQEQKVARPCKDTPGVLAKGGEDGVGGVARGTFETAEMADHRLDDGASSRLVCESAERATLLAGHEDAVGVFGAVPALTLVDVAGDEIAWRTNA
jgi:hypothetical protein